MRTMTHNQLLEAWAARRSDPAFSELVHSAALRQVGSPPLADDVAQAVFLVRARKAASLRRTTARDHPRARWARTCIIAPTIFA
jgi:hypothetical protein